MREELTKRQEANLEISRILEKLPIGNEKGHFLGYFGQKLYHW